MPHDQPVIPVRTADSHRFELIHVPAVDARQALLFLPGMGLSARQYIDFGRELSAKGIEVYIHEWRGIGSSNVRAARFSDWGYRHLLEVDLSASIDAIVERSSRQRLLIGGHSLGSQFACMLAGLAPKPCDGLVLVAGGSPYWRVFGPGMKLVMLGVIAAFPLIAAVRGHYPGRRLGFAGREARGVIFDWTRTAWTGRYDIGRLNTDLEAAMATLQLPVLAITMADDWFVPDASVKWLTGKLPGCTLTHHVIQPTDRQPADHYAWMQQPREAVGVIRRWLGTG